MPDADLASLARASQAALQRVEESRDRLLLAQTRMEMAAERAEAAFQRFAAVALELRQRVGDVGSGDLPN